MGGIWLKMDSDNAFREFGLLFQAKKDQNNNIKQLSIRAAVGNEVPIKLKITICEKFPSYVLQDGEEIVPSLQHEHITEESDAHSIFQEHDIALPAQGTANIQINMESEVLYFKVEHYSMDDRFTQFFGNIAPEKFDSINRLYEDSVLPKSTETVRVKNKWYDILRLLETTLSDCEDQPFADNIRDCITQLKYVRNEFIAGLIDAHIAAEEIREVAKYQLAEALEDFGEHFNMAFNVEVSSTMQKLEEYLAKHDNISKKPIVERLKIYPQLLQLNTNYVMALQAYVRRVDNLQRDNPPQSRRCSELAVGAREASETARLKAADYCHLMSRVLLIADQSAVAYMTDLDRISRIERRSEIVMSSKELQPHEKEKDWHKLYSNLSKEAKRSKHAEAAHVTAAVFYSQVANIITTIAHSQAAKWQNEDDQRRNENITETALLFQCMDKIYNTCVDLVERYQQRLFALEKEADTTDDGSDLEEIMEDQKSFSELIALAVYLINTIRQYREEINHEATVAAIQQQVAATVGIADHKRDAEIESKERERVAKLKIEPELRIERQRELERLEHELNVRLIEHELNVRLKVETYQRQKVKDEESRERVELKNSYTLRFNQIAARAKPGAPKPSW